MRESIADRLGQLDTASLDAVEVSGDRHGSFRWRTFTSLNYPDFDLCAPTTHDRYDVVICDQVLEHVVDPVAAARTLRSLCRPGATCIVTVPFLYRIHNSPSDYWRFTPAGLRVLLERAGFVEVETHAWGNRVAAARHLWNGYLGARRWRSLRNEAPVAAFRVGLCHGGAGHRSHERILNAREAPDSCAHLLPRRRAGVPATVVFSGTSWTTPAPRATKAAAPMCTPCFTAAPAPMAAARPMVTFPETTEPG